MFNFLKRFRKKEKRVISEETQKELGMNYEQLCSYLKEKYGSVPGNYFVKDNCKTRNQKITRGNEGLQIHHIAEDKYILLANSGEAACHPFELQMSENLVYCNYLEHLILHYLIALKFQDNQYVNPETGEFVGIGGMSIMIPEINDYFLGYPYKREYEIKLFSLIDKDDFLEVRERYINDVVHDNHLRYGKQINKEFLG